MERKMEVGMSQRKLVKSYLNLDALLPHNTPPGGQDLRRISPSSFATGGAKIKRIIIKPEDDSDCDGGDEFSDTQVVSPRTTNSSILAQSQPNDPLLHPQTTRLPFPSGRSLRIPFSC
jgi:hypothetical protein